MRKVLSFVLVLTLIMGSFSMAFAADTAVSSASLKDLKGTDFEMQASALVDLGVISGYTDGTFGGDKAVTRAEMATMICRALGLTESGANTFKDAKNHWGKAYIGMAQSLSVVTGYPDGTFKPDANVTYYEALAMIIKALGYNDDSLTGTWPNKYIVKAQALGISDDVTISGDNANRGDIAILLYQTLDSPIGITDKDGTWAEEPNRKIKDMMITRLKCYEDSDLIVRTANTALNLMPYVGAYGTVYKKSSNDKVMAIGDLDSTFLKGKFNAEGKFTADGVEYAFNANALSGTAIFQNAEQKNNLTTADYSNATLSDATVTYTIAVDLNGRTFDHVYSIARWSTGTGFKGEMFMASEYTLTQAKAAKKLGNYSFTLGADSVADPFQYALDGVESIGAIAKDNIVGIYANSLGEITKIEVGTNTVSGKITSVSNDNKATIDGKVYSAHTSIATADKMTSNEVSKEYKLFLAFNGNYFKGELVSGNDLYGVVMKIENGNDTLVSGGYAKIKMFTTEGTAKVYNVLEDAVNSINEDNISTFANGSVPTGSAVKFTLNKDGDINTITTYGGANANALNEYTTPYDITEKGTYHGREFVANPAIFSFAGNADAGMGSVQYLVGTAGGVSADDFSVAKLENLLDTEDVTAWFAWNTDGKIVAMIMDETDQPDNVYGFATSYGKGGTDADYYLTMLVNGESKTYDSPDNISTYNIGWRDLVAVTFSAIGQVKDLTTQAAVITVTGSATSNAAVKLDGNQLSITSRGAFAITTTGAFNYAEGGKVTIDVDTSVYVWDKSVSSTSQRFKAGDRSDLGDVEKIYLYDTDGDLIVDVIAIER